MKLEADEASFIYENACGVSARAERVARARRKKDLVDVNHAVDQRPEEEECEQATPNAIRVDRPLRRKVHLHIRSANGREQKK